MRSTEFLRAVSAVMPGRPSPARTSALMQFAPKLALDTREAMLTNACAEGVAHALAGDFPSYGQLLQLVRDNAAPADAPSQAEPTDEEGRTARQWERFIGDRLAARGDPSHLLSLLKAYCPPNHLRAVMGRVLPDALADLEARDREVARDKATRVARAAADLARASAMPHPKGAVVQTRPVVDALPRRAAPLPAEVLRQAREAAGVRPLVSA